MDGGICKCVLLAVNPGLVDKQHGMQVRVSCGDVSNEVKRLGFIRDREMGLEVRVGDTLIVYMSSAVA